MCAWCGADIRLEGPASRCTRCGGAHWACETESCRGALNGADRRYCSVCGGARPTRGEPNPHKLPRVTVIRAPLPVPLASKIKQDQGFYPRTAEGLYVEGRLILVGMHEILASPAPETGLDSAAGLGVLYQSPEAQDNLNSPLLLKNGVLLTGGKEGLCAISAYTGQIVVISKNKNLIAPVWRIFNPPNGIENNSHGESFAEIWTVESNGKSESELVRYAFRARACIEIGRFERLSSVPAPDTTIAATSIADEPRPQGSGHPPMLETSEAWFLIQDRATRELSWRHLSKGVLESAGDCGRARVPAACGRQRLWENKSGEGIYWLSRAGLENDDGALELSNIEGHASREIDVAYSWTGSPELTLLSPSLNLARERSLDGFWARVGTHQSVHFAWTAITEDDVRVSAEPALKDWGAGWVTDLLGFKPTPGNVGPVLPTPWGFVTCAVKAGAQPEFCAIYADFPLM